MNASIPIEHSVELLDIKEINPLISKCQVKVCYVQNEPNRNGSVITEDVARQLAGTLPGSPIVGFYNKETQDFEGHEVKLEYDEETKEYNFVDATFPYGFVDLGAKVWFQDFNDSGVIRKYLCTEGYLWTGQYPECGRIIEQGNNQSMELDEKTLHGVWADSSKTNRRFFIINEAVISKLCILGDNVEPCFEGASVTVPVAFSLKNSAQERMYAIINEMKNILDKGGFQMTQETEKELETPVEFEKAPEEKPEEFEKKPEREKEEGTENPAKDEEKNSETEPGKPQKDEDEKNQEDKKGKKYNLDEIPEYQELLNKYNDMKASFDSMESAIKDLKEFKLNAEKKEKEEMIQKFSMLEEEDKKDVIENIDKYSLDEIESKLSVICFRKKINFNLEEEAEETPAVNFSLDGLENDNAGAPSWVTMAMAVQKEING